MKVGRIALKVTIKTKIFHLTRHIVDFVGHTLGLLNRFVFIVKSIDMLAHQWPSNIWRNGKFHNGKIKACCKIRNTQINRKSVCESKEKPLNWWLEMRFWWRRLHCIDTNTLYTKCSDIEVSVCSNNEAEYCVCVCSWRVVCRYSMRK